MKITKVFFLTIFLLLSSQLISQQPMRVSSSSQFMLNQEWQQTENWLQTFRNTFGKNASPNWIGELAMEGKVFQNMEMGGFIIALPKYIQSNAKLRSKFQYGIYENKNTRLLPITDDAAYMGDLSTTRFLGVLGGVPASLDMAVVKQGGKYLTLMGFFPGHELENDFSKKFQQFIEKNYGGDVYASR